MFSMSNYSRPSSTNFWFSCVALLLTIAVHEILWLHHHFHLDDYDNYNYHHHHHHYSGTAKKKKKKKNGSDDAAVVGTSKPTTVATAAGAAEIQTRGKEEEQQQQQQHRAPVSTTSTTTSSESFPLPLAPPPLDALIDDATTGRQVIGNDDVSSLLDFSIIGFGKCGTTTLMRWLSSHPSLELPRREVWDLVADDPRSLVRRLREMANTASSSSRRNRVVVSSTTAVIVADNDDDHDDDDAVVVQGRQKVVDATSTTSSSTSTIKIGYKCPGEILSYDVAMNHYRRYFPRTKLIVAIKHPVRWFQSLYNFRVQNLQDFESMLHPNQLIGACTTRRSKMTCTRRGFFAYYLMRLGVGIGSIQQQQLGESGNNEGANISNNYTYTPLERQIMSYYGPKYYVEPNEIEGMPNEVFLVEMNQLADTDPKRVQQLRHDLTSYLGVSDDGISREIPYHKPGKNWNNATLQSHKDEYKIHDICSTEYLPVRRELLQLARMSSRYIRYIFLNQARVRVSNRPYFESLLKTWMYDPCDDDDAEKNENDNTAVEDEQ